MSSNQLQELINRTQKRALLIITIRTYGVHFFHPLRYSFNMFFYLQKSGIHTGFDFGAEKKLILLDLYHGNNSEHIIEIISGKMLEKIQSFVISCGRLITQRQIYARKIINPNYSFGYNFVSVQVQFFITFISSPISQIAIICFRSF